MSAKSLSNSKKGENDIKNGKKPTYEQRKVLEAWGINPREWLVSKSTTTEMVIVHRHTDTIRTITKGERK